MNPFNVAIAQGIAEVPLFSGQELRMVMWLVFTVFGLIFTMRYAAKVKANPQSSLSFNSDQRVRAAQSPVLGVCVCIDRYVCACACVYALLLLLLRVWHHATTAALRVSHRHRTAL